jgi:hypothetical protein
MSDRNERSAVAGFGRPHPRRGVAGEGDLLAAEARLIADHGAGAALALQAVAHRDARWFALNCKLKLSAAAGGVSRHAWTSWLSIRMDSRLVSTELPRSHLSL